MKAIDRKLVRDLAQMKAQVVTIALVIACGVAALVAALATYHSLRRSQEAFYVESHFADVFASIKRAPLSLAARIEAIPGLAAVELRVVRDVTLDVPGAAAPPVGRMISLPDRGLPLLNRLHVRAGRWPEDGRNDEVIVSEGFATGARARAGRHAAGTGQRALPAADRRRYRTVAGIRVRDPRRRAAARRSAVRHPVGAARGPCRRLRHDGGVQRPRCGARAGRVGGRGDRGARHVAHALRQPRCLRSGRADVASLHRGRDPTAGRDGADDAAGVPARRRVPAQRRARPHRRRAARADCGAEVAGLRQPDGGTALPQVRAGDRRAGSRRGARARRVARGADDRELRELLPAPGDALRAAAVGAAGGGAGDAGRGRGCRDRVGALRGPSRPGGGDAPACAANVPPHVSRARRPAGADRHACALRDPQPRRAAAPRAGDDRRHRARAAGDDPRTVLGGRARPHDRRAVQRGGAGRRDDRVRGGRRRGRRARDRAPARRAPCRGIPRGPGSALGRPP